MIIWRGEGMRNREDVVLFGPGMKGEGDHEKRQFSRLCSKKGWNADRWRIMDAAGIR